jgi:Flp pilus assembly protein TadD
MSYFAAALSAAYFVGERYEDSVEWARRAAHDQPRYLVAHRLLAASLALLGRPDEARAAYAKAKEDFPHEPVPANGYAETLRQLGRPDEALAAYAKAKEDFSRDIYAANGYAETLRQLGRLGEALAAYVKAKEDFPHDVVPFTGYAETLREMGRLVEAEREFHGILHRFANERVARNALACLLIETGRTLDARDLIPIESPKSEHDWRDYHVAAMAFLKEENHEEAEKRFAYGTRLAPFQSAKDVFRAALAFAKLRRRQYKEVTALVAHDNVLEFRLPAAAVINAHASAELGQLDRAEESLRDAERSRSAPVVRLSDFLRRRYTLGVYAGQLLASEEAADLDRIIAESEFDLALHIAA